MARKLKKILEDEEIFIASLVEQNLEDTEPFYNRCPYNKCCPEYLTMPQCESTLYELCPHYAHEKDIDEFFKENEGGEK